jgi:diketogulonate reductase-like aldo/keto reductase
MTKQQNAQRQNQVLRSSSTMGGFRCRVSKRSCLLSFLSVLVLSSEAFQLLPLFVSHRRHELIAWSMSTGRRPTGRRPTGRAIPPPITPPEQEKIEGESNFWVAVRKRDPKEGDEHRVPSYPNLDQDGSLPDACYSTLGDLAFEPKPSCLVSVDLSESTLDDDTVSYMHQCIDAGFTTIQGGTPFTYRQLQEETPHTVMNGFNLVTSVRVPTLLEGSPRDVLLRPLQAMGGSCMDTLQLQWNPKSPYFMDLLDMATELQREGVVRSIVGYRMPPQVMREAHGYGFRVESNQIPVNLLDPCRYYTPEMLLAVKDTNTALVVDNPLAGGLLSGRYYNRPGEPYKYELTRSERRNLGSLHQWSKRFKNNKDPWLGFQSNMMNVLHHIALKHRVSMEAVALRWALQLDDNNSGVVSRIVVPCDLRSIEEQTQLQPQRLRKVFLLELDEEEMGQLWEASGCEKPSADVVLDFENMEQGSNGLFL